MSHLLIKSSPPLLHADTHPRARAREGERGNCTAGRECAAPDWAASSYNNALNSYNNLYPRGDDIGFFSPPAREGNIALQRRRPSRLQYR